MVFITPGDSDVHEDYADGNEAGYTGRQGKLLRLAAYIDLESRLTIGCAGAVLTYIGRRKAVDYLPGDVGANSFFRVAKIERFNLKDVMYAVLHSCHSQLLWTKMIKGC